MDRLHGTTQMELRGEIGDTHNPVDYGDGHSPRTVCIVVVDLYASLVGSPFVVVVGEFYLVAGAAESDTIQGFLE